MGENTAIEWCEHTFSMWWGCTKVSAACDNCYAEAWARRFGVGWGPDAERRPASEATWRQPLKWNAKAEKAGKRARVFCASMAGATTFVSYEPALGPVDWASWPFLDLLISGGESGPKARPSHPDWHRAARDFCAANGVAYHFKQWGNWSPSNADEEDTLIAHDGRTGWMFWDSDRPACVRHIGKKAAGRMLDGRTHDDMPRTEQ